MKTKLLSSVVTLAALALAAAPLRAADDQSAPPPQGPMMERLLKRYDANHDGKLDDTERAQMEADRAKMGGERGGMRGMMERYDTNHDGKLDDAEKEAAVEAMRADIPNRPRMMERVDTDKDGKISDAEWAVAKKAILERFARGPGGGDGEHPRPHKDNR